MKLKDLLFVLMTVLASLVLLKGEEFGAIILKPHLHVFYESEINEFIKDIDKNFVVYEIDQDNLHLLRRVDDSYEIKSFLNKEDLRSIQFYLNSISIKDVSEHMRIFRLKDGNEVDLFAFILQREINSHDSASIKFHKAESSPNVDTRFYLESPNGKFNISNNNLPLFNRFLAHQGIKMTELISPRFSQPALIKEQALKAKAEKF